VTREPEAINTSVIARRGVEHASGHGTIRRPVERTFAWLRNGHRRSGRRTRCHRVPCEAFCRERRRTVRQGFFFRVATSVESARREMTIAFVKRSDPLVLCTMDGGNRP
jgi:hypothetical protein